MQELYSEHPVYLVLAITGTGLYVFKMLMLMLSVDGDAESLDGDDSFSLISIQSILAFLMGMGWVGLAAQKQWGLGNIPSLVLASAFGFAMMTLSSYLTVKMRQLNSSGNSSVNYPALIGDVAQTYSRIPSENNGTGQVEVLIDGKKRMLQASTSGEEIPSFVRVRIIDAEDNGYVTVEKI